MFSDFGSLFDLEHDLPDELINSTELGLTNGGDISQLQTSLGIVQDAASKHKQLSELLRSGSSPNLNMGVGGPGQGMASQAQQNSPGLGLINSMVKSPMAQAGLTSPNMGMGTSGPNQGPTPSATGMMSSPVNQPAMGMNTGMNAGMNPGMLTAGNGQGMMPNQVMNGSIGAGRGRPNMQYPNPGMGNAGNLMTEPLQQGSPQMGGQTGLRGPQPLKVSVVSVCVLCQYILSVPGVEEEGLGLFIYSLLFMFNLLILHSISHILYARDLLSQILYYLQIDFICSRCLECPWFLSNVLFFFLIG